MTTASEHIRRYPNARTSTLAHLIEREKMTKRLRREVQAKRNPFRRLIAALTRKAV